MKERLLHKHRIHEDEEIIEQVGSENLISPEDEVDEVSAVSEDQQSSKRMEVLEEVKSKFKETFEAGEHYLVCTYCSGVKEYKGSCRFKIFPQRGDLMKNLSNHVNSDIHKEMTEKNKKPCIPSLPANRSHDYMKAKGLTQPRLKPLNNMSRRKSPIQGQLYAPQLYRACARGHDFRRGFKPQAAV